MAGAKTFDLLLGVVLVVRCAELYAAETAARSHGKEPLTHALTRKRSRSRSCSVELRRECRAWLRCGATHVHTCAHEQLCATSHGRAILWYLYFCFCCSMLCKSLLCSPAVQKGRGGGAKGGAQSRLVSIIYLHHWSRVRLP